MISNWFKFKCTVYRLQNFGVQDYSHSQEGEVTENWVVVTLNQPCRYDPAEDPTQRRSDGFVEIGRRMFYMPPYTNVRNMDRIMISEWDGYHYYVVRHAHAIPEFNNKIHHIELTCEIIDWLPPADMGS